MQKVGGASRKVQTRYTAQEKLKLLSALDEMRFELGLSLCGAAEYICCFVEEVDEEEGSH